MSTVATTFRVILTGLQAVIALVAAKNHPRAELLSRAYFHLNRTIQRFEKLVAHWRDNTLPRQRKRASRPARPQSTPRLPTSQSWLVRAADHYNARGHASQLQHFLATPECVAFLAEVPRAGRILRPLAKSLGIQMPGDPPPPNPKPAKTPRLPRPAPPARGGMTPASTILTPNHPIFSKAR